MKKLLSELEAILGELPPVFARVVKPLKVGIDKDLHVRFPNVDREALSNWLERWTSSQMYVQRLAKKHRVQRYDLDGDPVGIVSDEERKHAQIEVSYLIDQAYRDKRPWAHPRA